MNTLLRHLSRSVTRPLSSTCWTRFSHGFSAFSTATLVRSFTPVATTGGRSSSLLSSSLWCQSCGSLPPSPASLLDGWPNTRASAMATTRRYLSTTKNDKDDNSSDAGEQPQSPTLQVTTSNEGTVSLEIPGTRTGGPGSRQLAIVFTCNVCETRSAKQFTENAYQHGVVLVRCPGCQNLHLIADRLGWFDDSDSQQFDLSTLEQMTGQKVKRVGDDDASMWEVSLEDLVGREKMQQLLKEQEGQQQQEEINSNENTKSS